MVDVIGRSRPRGTLRTSLASVSTEIRDLVSGGSWYAAASALSQGGTLGLSLIVSNRLGRDAYGRFALAMSTCLALAAIGQVALSLAASRYVAEHRMRDVRRTGRLISVLLWASVAVSLVLSSLLAMIAGPLARRFLQVSELEGLLRLISLVVALNVLSNVRIGVLTGLGAFRQVAVGGGVQGISSVILGGAGCWLGGLAGTVLGVTLGTALQVFWLENCVRRSCRAAGIPLLFTGILAEAPILTGFILPTALSSLTTVPAYWFASAAIARSLEGVTGVALFNAAWAVRTAVVFFPGIMGAVGGSLLSRQKGYRDEAAVRRQFMVNMTVSLVCIFLVGVPAAVAGGNLLRLFGPGFGAGEALLRVVLLSALPEVISTSTNQLLQIHERMWLFLFVVALPRDLLFILGSWLLAPHFGSAGVAWAGAGTWTLACLLSGITAAVVVRQAARRGWRRPEGSGE